MTTADAGERLPQQLGVVHADHAALEVACCGATAASRSALRPASTGVIPRRSSSSTTKRPV